MSDPAGATGDSTGGVGAASGRIAVGQLDFDPFTEPELVARVMDDLGAGVGGQIVTPNIDILRLAHRDREARHQVLAATVIVADGAPLVWASRLAGRPLPARVAGSDLIWSLSEAAAERGRTVYVLGGEPGTAEIAVAQLEQRFPALIVAGWDSPSFGFDASTQTLAQVSEKVVAAAPDIVFVGLGFPKQERLIAQLRPALPRAWFMGCGAAIGFVAGAHQRAPQWMRRTGLEWAHRLAKEPRRLARRYLLFGVPFAAGLLIDSAFSRITRRGDRTTTTLRRPI